MGIGFYSWLSTVGTIFVVYVCVYSVVNRLCKCAEKCAKYEYKYERGESVEQGRDEKSAEDSSEK